MECRRDASIQEMIEATFLLNNMLMDLTDEILKIKRQYYTQLETHIANGDSEDISTNRRLAATGQAFRELFIVKQIFDVIGIFNHKDAYHQRLPTIPQITLKTVIEWF